MKACLPGSVPTSAMVHDRPTNKNTVVRTCLRSAPRDVRVEIRPKQFKDAQIDVQPVLFHTSTSHCGMASKASALRTSPFNSSSFSGGIPDCSNSFKISMGFSRPDRDVPKKVSMQPFRNTGSASLDGSALLLSISLTAL